VGRHAVAWGAVGVVAALLAIGCRSDQAGSPGRSPDHAGAPAPAPARIGGLQLPRLDDAVAELRVLDEEVVLWRGRLGRDPGAAGPLCERLLRRAGVLGRLDDYVEADRVAQAWTQAAPTLLPAQRNRARVDAALHRFAAARARLDAAIAGGLAASEVATELAELALATGQAERALPTLRRAVDLGGDPAALVALARALGETGSIGDGKRLMAAAWRAVRTTSALAVAGLLFQWGRLLEEAGDVSGARDRYALAAVAAPTHHDISVHLAGVLAATGERDRAITLLEADLARADHPETASQLALLLRGRDAARAAALAARASAGWDARVGALPEAFADHAARHYLTLGDPASRARALALATRNHAVRVTVDSEVLLLEAAQVADDPAVGCPVRAALEARASTAPAAIAILARTAAFCPRDG